VRKAKNYQPVHLLLKSAAGGVFGVMSTVFPYSCTETIRHSGQIPEASQHSAQVHGISGAHTSQLSAKKKLPLF
jgi:hypothetical protein